MNDTYAVVEGALFAEINAILRKIRLRRIPEPTAAERAKLAELRAELTELRHGRRHLTETP